VLSFLLKKWFLIYECLVQGSIAEHAYFKRVASSPAALFEFVVALSKLYKVSVMPFSIALFIFRGT